MSESQTTNGTSQEQLSEGDEGFISSPNTTPPPRADEIDQWRCHIALQRFGRELQEAANNAFPNTTTSRYTNVYVLLLSWEDEDPQLPVSLEILELFRVFKDIYRFETETWHIPEDDCHAEVCQKILDFKKVGGNSQEHLKIVYYAGHGKLERNRLLSWTSWRNQSNLNAKCPTVKWGGIQSILEEAKSDVLLLLDCCHAGTANTNVGEGVTELISACAWNSEANGVGPYSFTNALVIELQDLVKKPSFSTGELYSNIFSRIQARMPENGAERHPAPVHLILTNDSNYRRSIQLSRLLVPEDIRINGPELLPQPKSHPIGTGEGRQFPMRGANISSIANGHGLNDSSAVEEVNTPASTIQAKVPRLAFAIRLSDNFQVDQLSTDLFLEWLRHIPTIADQVKVEADFDSFSSLLIVSIPLSLSGYLPPNRAILSLGPITSSNLIPSPRVDHHSATLTPHPPAMETVNPVLADEDEDKMIASSNRRVGIPVMISEKVTRLDRMSNGHSINFKVFDPEVIKAQSSPTLTQRLPSHKEPALQKANRNMPPEASIRKQNTTIALHLRGLRGKKPVLDPRHEIQICESPSMNVIWHKIIDAPLSISGYSRRLGRLVKMDRSAPSPSSVSRVYPGQKATREALITIISVIPGQSDDQYPQPASNNIDDGFTQLLELAAACWEYDCAISAAFLSFVVEPVRMWRTLHKSSPSTAIPSLSAKDSLNWMFIALVFELSDIFETMSKSVLIQYSPERLEPFVSDNEHLPNDYLHLVDETRRKIATRTYSYIRDVWAALSEHNKAQGSKKRGIYLHFKDRLDIDLRQAAPEGLHQQIAPNTLLLEFKMSEMEEHNAPFERVHHIPPRNYGRGGAFSITTRMVIHVGLENAKKMIKIHTPPESSSSGQSVGHGKVRRGITSNMQLDAESWRTMYLTGMQLLNSSFWELRGKHIQHANPDSSSPGVSEQAQSSVCPPPISLAKERTKQTPPLATLG